MRLKQLLASKLPNPSRAVATAAISAFALGATAVGAAAIGVLAIGRLLVGRLAIKAAHLRTLEIDELTVGSLHITNGTDRNSDEKQLGPQGQDVARPPSRSAVRQNGWPS